MNAVVYGTDSPWMSRKAYLSGFTGCGKMRVFKKKAALSG
jgi:hypothetical protein